MEIMKKTTDDSRYELILKNSENDTFVIHYGGADLYWGVLDYHSDIKFFVSEEDGIFYHQLVDLFEFIELNDNPYKRVLHGNCFEWLSEASGLEEEAHKLVIIKEKGYFSIEFIRNPLNWSPISTCFISFCLSGSRNQAIANEFSKLLLEYRDYSDGLINPKNDYSMLNVEDYRRYLENYFVYPYDKDTYEKRKFAISEYSDDFLQDVINNTKLFIKYILRKMQSENNVYNDIIFTSTEISEKISDIHNGCIGGYPSDSLYLPYDFEPNFGVSLYLLKQYFKDFTFEIREDVNEYYDEESDIGSISSALSLFISGPISSFEKIKDTKVLTFKPNQK